MLRDDNQFLAKWVEYYSACLGKENLFVFFDGTDQTVPSFCEGVNTTVVEHVPASRTEGDRLRATFLSRQAAELFGRGYQMVIGTDVDEFLAVDPALGVGLREFLSSLHSYCACISGLGVDVGQKLGEEAEMDWSRPMLSQRSYAKLSTRYSKASVLVRPAQWGSGFHRVKRSNYHIVKDLYLFHFGCADLARIKNRMGMSNLQAEGWSNHLEKRAGTIKLVSSARALPWEKTVARARRVQNVFRPPYALNKPSMFELKIVVRIPERFSGLF